MKAIDMTGVRVGRLLVLHSASKINNRTAWWCDCDCGTFIAVMQNSLHNGTSASCGCARRESPLKRNKKHGLAYSAEYEIWCGIKKRCTNPKTVGYLHYGERGIRLCDEWAQSFQVFLDHVGLRPSPKHSIDRIDNNGNYEPGNVRWATSVEQANNRRKRRWKVRPKTDNII